MSRKTAPRFALVLVLTVGAWSIGDAAYAHRVHRARALYGGQVTDAGRYHIELLIDENRHLRVYVRRAGGMVVPPEDVRASAVMMRDNGRTSLTIKPGGDGYLVSSEPIGPASYRLIEVDLDLTYGEHLAARLRPSLQDH
jgi:hypothetical protein